jgi:photosystem II stability/assembly factor-like uncharacterized protein
MKKITFIVSLLIISQSVLLSQSGWFQQYSGTNHTLNSVYFLNDQTGYVVGEKGVVLKTSNGGNNWSNIFNQTIYDASCVYFSNISTGWVYIDNGDYERDSSFIIKTTNEGLTWNKFYIDSSNIPWDFADLKFVNPNTGFLTNNSGVKKTTNGGMDWVTTFNYSLTGVFFTDSYTGWVGGRYPGIFKSTDAGVTWVNQPQPAIQNQSGVDLYFLNSLTGFCIPKGFGITGPLYSTTNGGINWVRRNELSNYSYRRIMFVNPNTGYMLAHDWIIYINKLAKTTDGGLNWVIHNLNYNTNFSKLFFSSINTGWAVGDSGVILKSTNGGVTIGVNQISTEIPQSFSLHQNYPNPFNPTTKIRFDMPSGSVDEHIVKLCIYDILGKEVTVLVNEELNPGVYEVDFDGINLPSGIYYYSLSAGSFTQTKKMVLIK